MAIYGTPDSVVKQIKSLYHKVGGFGHLIAMLHAGDMSYELTAKSMTLFAKEVMPKIKHLGSVSTGFGPLAERKKARPKTKTRKKAKSRA